MKKYFLVLISLFVLGGCSSLFTNFGQNMTIKNGSNVSVLYTGSLEDGNIFDASSKHGGKPLEFTAGAGQMIAGFDTGVIGMKVGETKKIEIEAKDAYGEYDESKKRQVPKTELKDFSDNGFKLEKGERIPTQVGNVLITESDETTVTIDTNHELAGKKLIFEVTVVDIK